MGRGFSRLSENKRKLRCRLRRERSVAISSSFLGEETSWMRKQIQWEASTCQIAPAPRGLRRQPSRLTMKAVTGKSFFFFFSRSMREALSRLLLLLCCCVLCAALRSVAGAVRSERERHWTALVGRETTRRPALREREATESVLLSRISMWRSTFSRCRRQEFFTLSFASGASFANQKKVTSSSFAFDAPPLFSTRGAAFFALPSSLAARARAPARPCPLLLRERARDAFASDRTRERSNVRRLFAAAAAFFFFFRFP